LYISLVNNEIYSAEFEKWRTFGEFTKSSLVNTSSLCAVQTFSYLSLYCTFKYARNALMEIVAKEHVNYFIII
jgi:NAD(P)-dependent dehydrogenase (short-subunit alcohol dehydrogenase family)